MARRTQPSSAKAGIRRKPAVRPKVRAGTAKRKAGKAEPARKRRSFLGFVVYWGTVLGLWGGIAVVGIFAFFAVQLPSANTWNVPQRPPDMRILAVDGTPLANRGTTGGKALRLEAMSPHIPNAVIAIEDRRFHYHFGFDPIGFARAVFVNVTTGRRQGGSTLTQQLAKNLFLTPERSYGRKVQELILAFWLEANYSKNEILEMYLNRVYFGAGATGVDAAARRYFGKSASRVTAGEAALLAGLLKAPSALSPARYPERARKRANVVLAAMRAQGYVTKGNVDVPAKRAASFARHGRTGPQQYAADMVARRVNALLGDVSTDIVVTTTLDPALLDAAQAEIHSALSSKGKKHKVSQGALVAMTPKGAVRALIGGRDYATSAYNRVLAERQPGSAFKPLVWLNAFERGATANDTRMDGPVRYGKWAPVNYDRTFRGEVTLREAFARSLNTVAAKLTMEVGPAAITNSAKRLGAKTPLTPRPSVALGTGEMTLMDLVTIYAPFANGGRRVSPYLIREIRTTAGKVLYRRADKPGKRVISSRALAQMGDVFSTAIHHGTGKEASLGPRPAGGKTGTTQGLRDALFVGYTADLVTAVWFGNDNNSPMRDVTGASLPATAWRGFMKTAHVGLAMRPIPATSGAAPQPLRVAKPTFRPAVKPAIKTAVKTVQKPRRSLRQSMTQLVRREGEKILRDQVKRSMFELIAQRQRGQD